MHHNHHHIAQRPIYKYALDHPRERSSRPAVSSDSFWVSDMEFVGVVGMPAALCLLCVPNTSSSVCSRSERVIFVSISSYEPVAVLVCDCGRASSLPTCQVACSGSVLCRASSSAGSVTLASIIATRSRASPAGPDILEALSDRV